MDNVSDVPYNEKRRSVRLETQDSYPIGSLWTFDFNHVPYGCSVWPAAWASTKTWPQGGEIDTFEGVNLVETNQVRLPSRLLLRPLEPALLYNVSGNIRLMQPYALPPAVRHAHGRRLHRLERHERQLLGHPHVRQLLRQGQRQLGLHDPRSPGQLVRRRLCGRRRRCLGDPARQGRRLDLVLLARRRALGPELDLVGAFARLVGHARRLLPGELVLDARLLLAAEPRRHDDGVRRLGRQRRRHEYDGLPAHERDLLPELRPRQVRPLSLTLDFARTRGRS